MSSWKRNKKRKPLLSETTKNLGETVRSFFPADQVPDKLKPGNYCVLMEPLGEGRFRATSIFQPHLNAEGDSREEAIHKLNHLVKMEAMMGNGMGEIDVTKQDDRELDFG